MKTRIDGAWVVGFDESAGSHVLYEDGVVVFENDELCFVGESYSDEVDRHLSGQYLVIPGLINMHAHLDAAISPFWYDTQMGTDWMRPKAWVEDPDERPVFSPAEIEQWARHSMAVLLQTGTTTFADLTSFVCKRWDDPIYEPHIYAQTAGELGLRAYLSHRYRSAVPYYEDGQRDVLWDEARGERGFERALEFLEQYHGTYDDRIRTMLFPYTLDSVTEDLLRQTKEAADEHGVQVRIHAAQSKGEVERLDDRHGLTPVEYLEQLGFLDENVCLTHALYLDGQWRADGVPTPDDDTLAKIGDAGTAVIYCPVVYRRRGGVMNSFSRYGEQGITMALGTDTFPQNILEEIRWAALGTKLITEDPAAGTARELFDAVTLGGAQALGRTDIGRLTPGAKADVVAVDLSGTHVRPTDDPLTSLVHYATPADVAHVFIDGEQVVRDGEIPDFDEQDALAGVQRVHEKMGDVFTDWKGTNEPSDLFSSSYPVDRGFDRTR